MRGAKKPEDGHLDVGKEDESNFPVGDEEIPDLIDVQEDEEEEQEVLIHGLTEDQRDDDDEEEIDKILGIVWDMRRDRLSVAVVEEKFSSRARTP